MQSQISREFGGVQPKTGQVVIAKKEAETDPFGTCEEQFAKLESLCTLLRTADKDACVELTMENNVFHRFFWSYGPAKHFLTLQRKLLSCDGSGMRGHSHGNILLLAAEDSEDEQVVLAIMFTSQNESLEEWSFFIEKCASHIIGFNSNDVGLISDRDKGS